jgi:serine/threonine protein kinase
MSDVVHPAPGSLPPTRWQGLLAVYDRFEAAWRTGQEPRIEDYLGETPAPDLSALLHELLALEVELRRDRGESPTPEEYHSRFRGHAELIGAVFAETVSHDATSRPATPQRAVTLPPGAAVGLPERFGRYQILRCLGRGGMGAVYLAHDCTLDRRVALKVPFFTEADGPLALDRFLREARAAAALCDGRLHRNLCPIHDVGQIDGIHYLTMTYLEGRPLSEHLRPGQPTKPRKAAALVRTLALALEEAHRAGVIHRDLKPSNIMITRNGVPVIVDFGLARRLRKGDPRLTASGTMIGTPAYMPPEQLQGRVAAMGPGCDIYSLGVIFYELLAGRGPFLGSIEEIVGQILHVTPEPPSVHHPGLDPRLDVICLKATAKEIEDRYPAMSDLAAALNEYLLEKSPPATVDSPAPRPSVGDRSWTSALRTGPATVASPVPRPSLLRRSLVALLVAGTAVLVFLALRFMPAGSPAPSRVAARKSEQNPPATPAKFPVSPRIAKDTLAPPERSSFDEVQPENREEEDPEIAGLTDKIRRNPEDIRAINARGDAYFERGKAAGNSDRKQRAKADYDRAIADFTEVIRRTPLEADAYFNRGNAFFEKHEFARAIADYTEAIRLRPGDPEFYLNRGNAYVESGDNDRAIQDFDAAIGIKPDDYKPFDGRGRAYAEKGDTARAKADYAESDRLRARSAAPQPEP